MKWKEVAVLYLPKGTLSYHIKYLKRLTVQVKRI